MLYYCVSSPFIWIGFDCIDDDCESDIEYDALYFNRDSLLILQEPDENGKQYIKHTANLSDHVINKYKVFIEDKEINNKLNLTKEIKLITNPSYKVIKPCTIEIHYSTSCDIDYTSEPFLEDDVIVLGSYNHFDKTFDITSFKYDKYFQDSNRNSPKVLVYTLEYLLANLFIVLETT